MLIMLGKYPNQIVNIWILKCINSLYSDFILYIPCCRVLFLTGNETPFSTQVRVHHLLLNPARMGTGLTSGSPTEESTWTSATCGWRDARWRRMAIQARLRHAGLA